MKNILFVLNKIPNIGGIETVTTQLANRLSEKYNISILSTGTSLDKQPGLKNDIAITVIPENISALEKNNLFNQYLSEKKIDVIINQGCNENITQLFFDKKFPDNIKIISVLHGQPMNEIVLAKQFKREQIIRKKSGFSKYLKLWLNHYGQNAMCKTARKKALSNQKKLYQISNYIIVLQDFYIDEYALKYHIPDIQKKLRAIPNPSIYGQSPNVSEKKNEILYVGRLSNSDKRVDRLLKIWKLVEPQCPDWSLKILGDGEDRNKLETLAQSLKLNNIAFLGYQNPEPFYKSARIVCLTSQTEGLPMSLIEAQTFGTIPIAFECSSGISYILEKGNSGICIPPYKMNIFANKLATLIKNQELLDTLSQRAKISSGRFNENVIVSQWIQLIES